MLQSSWFQARLLSSLPRLLLTSLHRAFKADVLLTEGFKHKAKARCQVVQDARALSQSDNKIHLASFLFLKKWWMMLCCRSMIEKMSTKVISKYTSCLRHSARSLHFAHYLPLWHEVGCPDSCWDMGVGRL